jgi:hypothetical protein
MFATLIISIVVVVFVAIAMCGALAADIIRTNCELEKVRAR